MPATASSQKKKSNSEKGDDGGKRASSSTSSKVVVVHTDMDQELQDQVKSIALNAMKNLDKGELQYFMDVAKVLKESLDSHIANTCWHVVVGKQFGSFVTNERKKIILLQIGAISVLAFQHG
eukprot:INCI18341.1.p2 GENE.INCI18341.1~~INCI18341.1.p2  ORF type:complete len:122 (-),score=31.04 INCI18341.1:129-494(-)